MSFNFNLSTNIDITKKILKFISLLKLLKFKSFCNVNQHYLIIVLLPPPPPPPPFFPPQFPPFWGGGKGTGGRGQGGRGGDGGAGDGGEPLHRPPLNEGGGTKSPPLLPQDFTKKTFLRRLIYKHFHFFSQNIQIFKICVIYLP